MKLELELDGHTFEAEFSSADGAARISFDGRTHNALVSEPEPGLYTILLDNHIYACTIDKLPNGAIEVLLNGRRIPVAVRNRKHISGAVGGIAGAGGRAVLTSPMPGKVARIFLNAGDEVAANQGVLIVEAMKMQNEVQSPKAGKVVEIKVAEGQTVNAGEMLAVIE